VSGLCPARRRRRAGRVGLDCERRTGTGQNGDRSSEEIPLQEQTGRTMRGEGTMYGSRFLENADTRFSDDYLEAVSALYSDDFYDPDDGITGDI
jgi:hypothetical protein